MTVRRTSIFLATGIAIVGAIAWFSTSYPTYTYRFRLTVEVEANGEIKTGSSVIEVQNKTQPRIFPEVPPVLPKTSGEAVFVDLGSGRNLIATLAFGPTGNGDRIGTLALKPFGVSLQKQDLAKLPMLSGARELAAGDIPTLVTFTDLSDPKSVRVVPPGEFERMFGAGVRLKRVVIEMTADPITRQIERILPWLSRMKAEGYDGMIQTYPGRFTTNVPYFTRG